VGVGVAVDDTTVDCTNEENVLASVSDPLYCWPFTMTVGVPPNVATFELGSFCVVARFVAAFSQFENLVLSTHFVMALELTPALFRIDRIWEFGRPPVFSCGCFS
jgi:hypothetical protein